MFSQVGLFTGLNSSKSVNTADSFVESYLRIVFNNGSSSYLDLSKII